MNFYANRPNWKLLTSCKIGGKKGLVLVEAKANCAELKYEGKGEPENTKNSRENHKKIDEAIKEARKALDKAVPGVRISLKSHYQLANRVAYTWKLASLGIPTVLVYLGFFMDKGIVDVGEPFKDESHWIWVMRDYIKGVIPEEFLERPIDCGQASMWMIIRSREIQKPSPPVPGKK